MAGRFLWLEGVPSALPCPGSQLRAGGVSSLAGAHVRGACRGGLAGAAERREVRAAHLAGGKKQLLHSEGCREKQLRSLCGLGAQGGLRVMGAVCLLHPLQHWQKEKLPFVGPPTLSFPGGCKCYVGHGAPGWGVLEMSRRTKEGCRHNDISAEAAETPPLSLLLSEAKASRSVVRAASQQVLAPERSQ